MCVLCERVLWDVAHRAQVTDIENSTNYWEMFSPQVMDVTLKLHNTCIRRLAAKHGG